MDKVEEARIREKIEWYQTKVLNPLNTTVAYRHFNFPLDRQYFGERKLGVEFGDDLNLEDCFRLLLSPSDSKVYLEYDIIISLPFTLPVSEMGGFMTYRHDADYIDIACMSMVANLINRFPVMRILEGYFLLARLYAPYVLERARTAWFQNDTRVIMVGVAQEYSVNDRIFQLEVSR